jgi:hypothetical protein
LHSVTNLLAGSEGVEAGSREQSSYSVARRKVELLQSSECLLSLVFLHEADDNIRDNDHSEGAGRLRRSQHSEKLQTGKTKSEERGQAANRIKRKRGRADKMGSRSTYHPLLQAQRNPACYYQDNDQKICDLVEQNLPPGNRRRLWQLSGGNSAHKVVVGKRFPHKNTRALNNQRETDLMYLVFAVMSSLGENV